jgi:hypothetical protein
MSLFLLAALLTSIAPVQSPEPNRQPELAASSEVTAVTFGSGHSIWLAVSHDRGVHFLAAREVARVPVLALGRHRGPRVAISGKTIIVSAVFGGTPATGPHAHGLPADGDLVAWRSADEGVTWSQPIVINDVPGAAREGLHAMAAGTHGEVAAAWLDLRSSGTKLYAAYSTNNGESWSKNVLLYQSANGTICQCCHPSLVSTGDGSFAAMFRNVVDGSRDMYVIDWRTGGPITAGRKAGSGSWNIDACPMDGGGLAEDGNTTVTAWRRDHTVYLAKAGQKETSLGEGKDVALAESARGPYVIWSDPSGIVIRLPGKVHNEILCPGGAFPTLASLPDGSVLAAWEHDGSVQLQVLR